MIKRSNFLLLASLIVILISCNYQSSVSDEPQKFKFTFLTDIHLQKGRQATEGFRAAIAEVNEINPDFVITGGDLIMDALGVPYESADSLYKLYISEVQEFKMPVHNTMGNHEAFGFYERSGAGPEHPEYGSKMFEKRIGETYYSFDHKGWHFMILNSIQETDDRHYFGNIDEAQMEWIRNDLQKVDPKTPIVISTHIPFITVFTQYLYGEYAPDYHGLVVENTRDVLDLFIDHNLKLVLQGHLHYLEYIELDGISFITGGAVSAQWWKGPNHGIEEGFLTIFVEDDDFSWEYVDYGWDAP